MAKLTIVVPAHNEENRIEKTLNKYINFFNAKKVDYEILVVLNGCIDNTLERVKDVASKNKSLRYININEAIGKGGAIKEGIRKSGAEFVGFVDADCSVEPSEFYKLFRNIGGNDCVIASRYVDGSKILVRQPFKRVIASRVFNMIVRLMFLIPFKDTQCGAKIIVRKPLIALLGKLRITDWAFDVNLVYLLHKKGLKIKEIPIRWKDTPGSKLDLKKVSPKMLLSILRLRMIYSPLSRFTRHLRPMTGTLTKYFMKDEGDIFFSIIIPFRKLDSEIHECMDGIMAQSYDNFEIILLPDSNLKHIRFNSGNVRIIPTGSVKPSSKRNIGINDSRGNICAFIDSDAAPEKNWLRTAARTFIKDSSVGIVGGPNLDKADATSFEKASGDILSSRIGAGKFALRYSKGKECEAEELPSCNLFVRKNILDRHSISFDESFLTAEDSKLCFDVAKTGAKVMYNPELQVFHRRRELFLPHMKQMWIYGRDKAHLIRRQKIRNSPFYFMPSFFLIFNVAGMIASFFSSSIRLFYLSMILLYLSIVTITSLKKRERMYLIFFGTILTHISYGLGFLFGLLKRVRD